MDSKYYRQYKRRFMMGIAALFIVTCVALAKFNLLLGVFGATVLLIGFFGFNYMDQQEQKARLREIKAEVKGKGDSSSPDEIDRCRMTAVMLLQIDDYDEVFQDISDDQKPLLVAAVDKFLKEWAGGHHAYLRKDGRDRYLVLLPLDQSAALEKEEFASFDQIRQVRVGEHLPVTISAGVGKNESENDPATLGLLAQQALDLALSRGGDQVIVKSPEQTFYYGGKSQAVGKRSQVRARVTATELERLLRNCPQVVLMGHSAIDFDAFGAALGLARVAKHYVDKVKLVVDHPGGAIERLFQLVEKESPGLLVDSGKISGEVTPQTLLILCDVHRPQMVPNRGLLRRAGSVAVIDHHRRGEQFPERTDLTYLEPAASSTCELVGDLIRYLSGEVSLSPLTATALLAGLVVDTKKFTFNTTARTFRAAAYFKEAGAHQALLRDLFTDDLETMLYRARLVKEVRIELDRFAVAWSEEDFPEAKVAASRAADMLLEVRGVAASFTIYPLDGGAGISARSTGAVNVHRIMEKLGGGGHFTVAGARLGEVTVQEAHDQLLKILEDEQEEKE